MIDLSDHIKIEKVINYFLQMSRIPRGSGNTKEIADFLYAFGKDRGLESYRDEYDNVVIKKPASRGYEDRPTLVIQGHLDMVCEKEADCTKDMEKRGPMSTVTEIFSRLGAQRSERTTELLLLTLWRYLILMRLSILPLSAFSPPTRRRGLPVQ
jgi:hypothetical protein